MYFTACNRPDGLGRCDIYFSMIDGKNWSLPKNIGAPVNSEYWESQPSISADGKTLYFVSNRPGGIGGMDIWITEMDENGEWGEPYNAGDVINTPGDETTPFIHFDGKTLYFSSNGRPNLGGYDIYLTRIQDDESWSEPVNLGYPINTHRDEMGLTIESNGIRAYYASTATPGGEKALFYFDLHEAVRPEQVSFLKGRVFDSETRRSLIANYELTNLTSGNLVASELTTDEGEFFVCLPAGFNYGLNISAEGYLFYSENFPFDGEYSDFQPLVKDIHLRRIKEGEKLVLYNVLFDINSSDLMRQSEAELSKLLALMLNNPSVTVEISGHTDDTGSKEYNQSLSEQRALAVVRYLSEHGVDNSRMTHRGYGMTKPVADNIAPEGRRLNRRTEVMITGSKP
jgi:outer membrane protein OmpA-like peptidoglycan-associated protein